MRKPLVLLLVCLFLAVRVRADESADPRLSSPPKFYIGGFADAVLHSTSTNTVRHLVEIDMYSTLRLSDTWSALAEGIAQRAWRPPEAGEMPAVELDLERFYVSYHTTDAFRIEVGETHTGIVRWNEREHRSRFLQTPIEVPAIARQPQDDGAWPLRFVGIWAAGRTSGPLRFTWEGGAGAGPGSEREAIPILTRNRSPAVFLSMGIAPRMIGGFDAGVALYAQHIPMRPDALRERDVTLFSNYVIGGTEIRAEWARLDHQRIRLRKKYRNQGYYILFSKRLTGPAAHARPYLLLDHLNVDAADPYLPEATSENAWAAGIRYDFTERFSTKGEYRSQRALDGSRKSVVGLQIGVSF